VARLRRITPLTRHADLVSPLTCVFRVVATLLLAGNPLSAGSGASAQAGSEVLAPGVAFRTFTIPAHHGSTRIYLVTVNLRSAAVAADLLFPGSVSARQTVSRMAGNQGAIAAVNGNFFDIDESQHPGIPATGAPSGPAVMDGLALDAAVPAGQQFGWKPPVGDSGEDVVGVGVDGVARIAQLSLSGRIHAPETSLPLGGLNQYALPVDSIGLYTPQWGASSRARAVCGTDTNRGAPCATDTYEVTVRNGRVAALSGTPGNGVIPAGTFVLLGRETGADALRTLTVGTPVQVDYQLDSGSGVPFAFALGAEPLVRFGRPVPGLDTTTADPRTAVCISDNGHTLALLATDGREGTSSGLTLGRLAGLMQSLGCTDAANLDGGGSTTLVTRDPPTGRLIVRNGLAHGLERPVPNGIAIVPR
jgi:phosphodiester glycosidase